MQSSKIYFSFILFLSLFSYQYTTAQNLLSDSSCEMNYSGGDTHFVNTWTTSGGGVQCFNATSLLVPTANPSEGSFFFADANVSATLSEMSQTVDLGGDQSGKTFFYSYDYRMIDMTARPTHTADVLVLFLDASDIIIGNMHTSFGFTDTQLDGDYITVSGTDVAPAGTRKIRWIVRWIDSGTYNELIMDNFILTMQPDHDICENAIPLECGDYVLGQTQAATAALTSNDTPAVLAAYDACSFSVPANHGVFYSFVGTGSPMMVSTDYPYTKFDSRISIYTGTCSAPTCVAENDDINFDGCTGPNANLKSEVTFPTVSGQTYYIYVHGTSGCGISESGNFGLRLDCVVGIPIDFPCGESITGSTNMEDDTYSNYTCSGIPAPYTGNDAVHEFEVLETETYTFTLDVFLSDLALFLIEVDGQGNFLNCVDYSDVFGVTSSEQIVATLTPGNYLIIVDACCPGEKDTYTLDISCEYDGNLSNFVLLAPKVFLQGALKSTSLPAMNTTLQANGLIPSVAPDGSGTVAENGIGTDIVDWVIVELRDATDNTIVRARQSCLLRNDGQVLGANRAPFLIFPALDFDEAYIVVRHRNHLGIMSGSLVSF